MRRLCLVYSLLLLFSGACARQVASVDPAAAPTRASTATPMPTPTATATPEPVLSVSLAEGRHAFPSARAFEIALGDLRGEIWTGTATSISFSRRWERGTGRC
jgi:hypothetical protein